MPTRPGPSPGSSRAAAGQGRGPGARDAGLALYPPAGAVGPGRLVHLGVSRSEAGPGRPAVCGPTHPGRPVIAQAYTLSQAFLALVRERRGDALAAWITEATASGIAALARFAQGLQEDLPAITAGLTLPWSNGPVEGQVNRLKLLKRQSYGRAGVRLLRQRVLHAV